MALETIITIELGEPGLGLPYSIIVPRGSRLSFRYRGMPKVASLFGLGSVNITLYFEGRVLQGFKRSTTTKVTSFDYDTDILHPSEEVKVLAEGVALESGDYKYGVRIVSDNGFVIDEDPFITVI